MTSDTSIDLNQKMAIGVGMYDGNGKGTPRITYYTILLYTIFREICMPILFFIRENLCKVIDDNGKVDAF